MNQLWQQPWAIWAIGVVVGLPLLLVVLGESAQRLAKFRSPFVRPLQVIRLAVLPLGAVLLLLTRGAQVGESLPVQLLETCFTIVLVLAVLLLIDAAMASLAQRGPGRQPIPGIFVDLARVVLVIGGIFVVLARVWTAPVEHFLTALGVTTIVIGIALQSAVGNVISGLLLLSERPFSIGDWVQVGTLTGRVNEINWRAVHLDTGTSIQVVPNGTLATSTFANFSRPAPAITVTTTLHFSIDVPPDRVCKMLTEIAAGLPEVMPGTTPTTDLTIVDAGTCSYETTFMVASFETGRPARTSFLMRAWFASRRAGFTLSGMPAPAEHDDATPALRSVASILRLDDQDITALAPRVRVEQFAPGEIVQLQGDLGPGLRIILDGVAKRSAVLRGRGNVSLGELRRHDAFGGSALTNEPALATVVAVDNLVVLTIPNPVLNQLLDQKPLLANDFGQLMDRLRAQLAGPGTTFNGGNGAASARY